MHHIPYPFKQVITDNALILIVRDLTRTKSTITVFSQRKRLSKPTSFIREVQRLYARPGGYAEAIGFIKRTKACSLNEALNMMTFMCQTGREPDGKV